MPLALSTFLTMLIRTLRFPENRLPEPPQKRGRLDLCLLPPYLRRDIGFETFRCETREDWRTFR